MQSLKLSQTLAPFYTSTPPICTHSLLNQLTLTPHNSPTRLANTFTSLSMPRSESLIIPDTSTQSQAEPTHYLSESTVNPKRDSNYETLTVDPEMLRIYPREVFFSSHQAKAMNLYSDNGRFYQNVSGKKTALVGRYMYVIYADQKIRAIPDRNLRLRMEMANNKDLSDLRNTPIMHDIDWHQIRHSSLAQCQSIICAGHMEFDEFGRLESINNDSGHYKPKKRHLYNAVSIIKNHYAIPCRHLVITDVADDESPSLGLTSDKLSTSSENSRPILSDEDFENLNEEDDSLLIDTIFELEL